MCYYVTTDCVTAFQEKDGCGEEGRSIVTYLDKGAALEFRRMLKWIALAAILMVVAALAYLVMMDSVTVHTVLATILGVLFSVLLGCGLFALAFFSNKSGHDEDVSLITKKDNTKT